MNRHFVSLAMLIVLSVATGCNTITVTTRPTQTPLEELCVDGIAVVDAWVDQNGNGLWEGSEPPLSGVGIMLGNSPMEFTDEDGEWLSGLVVGDCGSRDEVRASMALQCKSLRISAFPPVGYTATTETTVNGSEARFGFMRLNIPSP